MSEDLSEDADEKRRRMDKMLSDMEDEKPRMRAKTTRRAHATTATRKIFLRKRKRRHSKP